MHTEGKYNLVFLGVPFITVLLFALYTSYVEFKYKLPSTWKDQIDTKVSNLYKGREKKEGDLSVGLSTSEHWSSISYRFALCWVFITQFIPNSLPCFFNFLFALCWVFITQFIPNSLPCFFNFLSLHQLEVSSQMSIIHCHLISSINLSYALVA